MILSLLAVFHGPLDCFQGTEDNFIALLHILTAECVLIQAYA